MPVGSIVGGRLRAVSGDTAGSEDALRGRLWGEPLVGPPKRMQSGGPLWGFSVHAAARPCGRCRSANGGLGFDSGEGA